MTSAVRLYGLANVREGLQDVLEKCKDFTLITEPLAEKMREFVHVDTGYLQSTIYNNAMVAGANAPYAGYEADRGGEHDYAQLAIDNFDIEAYADKLVEGW